MGSQWLINYYVLYQKGNSSLNNFIFLIGGVIEENAGFVSMATLCATLTAVIIIQSIVLAVTCWCKVMVVTCRCMHCMQARDLDTCVGPHNRLNVCNTAVGRFSDT
jgi:hypothetical protein